MRKYKYIKYIYKKKLYIRYQKIYKIQKRFINNNNL